MIKNKISTKIFLDSGDPIETKKALKLLGWLDGQTTNPSLVAKNPRVLVRLERGDQFSESEIYHFYQDVVEDVSELIPDGSVSIEVYSDENTSEMKMLEQAKEMFTWIPNAHIKLPVIKQGINSAKKIIAENMRVNMTLCFSQEQAAAVHLATQGADPGSVFISPFIGRLNDQGENGMNLVANIQKMFREQNSHVQLLAASIRNLDQLMKLIQMKVDIITVPFKILEEWADSGFQLPDKKYEYKPGDLKPIEYQDLDFSKEWFEFDLNHPLTVAGIEKFANDWNNLIR
ncbi:transaldolase [Candidatus Falkowbacteria bacterium CG10_big_fil_rev_8_21_14_0_10_39_11]|uniref:Transaldolase n=1 Tax=Candidatus Falkowbacteria bacterium CG10_big_fil_rev_8_21_14_0_10_39_11 TaxID=1974565 RepID=A0A2H0V3T7_9BACT|nr:MAG: transaldolase [Candidatus Falkowbacteria bacterium CG10_big_fil_rev_8_21_14_0_10_39_11]